MDTRRLRAAIFERSGIAIDEHDPIMAVVAACAQQTEEIGALLLGRTNPVRIVVAVTVAAAIFAAAGDRDGVGLGSAAIRSGTRRMAATAKRPAPGCAAAV